MFLQVGLWVQDNLLCLLGGDVLLGFSPLQPTPQKSSSVFAVLEVWTNIHDTTFGAPRKVGLKTISAAQDKHILNRELIFEMK